MANQEQNYYRESQVYAVTSDGSGRFTLRDVPAGRYRFFATHTGYVDQLYQSTEGETGTVFALQAGQEIKDVLFRTTLAAVLTRRVNDENGEPMASIQVVALCRPSNEEMEDQEDSPSRGQELYSAIPSPAPALFQAASANLNPWSEAKVNSTNPERGPMLIISADSDHTVPWAIANASYKKHNKGVTEIVKMPGRGHALTSTPAGGRSPKWRSSSSNGSQRSRQEQREAEEDSDE